MTWKRQGELRAAAAARSFDKEIILNVANGAVADMVGWYET
jgi:hypothetical protein